MKGKRSFSEFAKGAMAFFTANRTGHLVESKRWDNTYDCILCHRINRYGTQKQVKIELKNHLYQE